MVICYSNAGVLASDLIGLHACRLHLMDDLPDLVRLLWVGLSADYCDALKGRHVSHNVLSFFALLSRCTREPSQAPSTAESSFWALGSTVHLVASCLVKAPLGQIDI